MLNARFKAIPEGDDEALEDETLAQIQAVLNMGRKARSFAQRRLLESVVGDDQTMEELVKHLEQLFDTEIAKNEKAH